MKRVDVATVVLGACNAAIAGAQAKSCALVAGTAESVTQQLVEQLKKRNVNLVVGNVEKDLEKSMRQATRATVLATLTGAEKQLAGVTSSTRLQQRVGRVKDELSNDSPDMEVVATLLQEVTYDLVEELRAPMFVSIEPDLRSFYEQSDMLFGGEVASAFPDAAKDISAANRCYALDEWTACVFHAMRVLEHGLRLAAERFAVDFSVDSWHTVIRGIEGSLHALRNKQVLTEQDRKEITYYSEAASQFRYFKDAWRNHVSHARTHYDEGDAEKVLRHVREFMQHLAAPA